MRLELLPKWVYPDSSPSLYDTESVTALEGVSKLHAKMNELVTDYNKFADLWNNQIMEFEYSTTEELKVFEASMRQEFQDFIDVINLKYDSQEGRIDSAINKALADIEDQRQRLLTDIELAAEIVQIPGESETAVISQKGITKNFAQSKIINLFNKNTVTSGILNKHSGNIQESTIYNVSDFIEVEMGKTYSYLTKVSLEGETLAKELAVYDSEKNHNGYIRGSIIEGDKVRFNINLDLLGITVYRDDIKYVRINVTNSQLESTMFVEDENYPDEFYEFGKNYLNKEVNLQDYHIKQIKLSPINSALRDKKIVYNGDSICESRTDTSKLSYNGGAYPKIIADLTGSHYENRAIGGGILASSAPGTTQPARRVSIDIVNMSADADLVCFEGGINDYWKSVPLGDFSESDFTSEVDTTTLSGALESIFRQAINKWVGKPICFIITHKMTSSAYKINNAGYTFVEARERMIKICEKYSIPYFDAFTKSGLNAYMSVHNSTYLIANNNGTPDGCHPNEEGYRKYYVPQLIKFFESLI